jgi:hypothetical protein
VLTAHGKLTPWPLISTGFLLSNNKAVTVKSASYLASEFCPFQLQGPGMRNQRNANDKEDAGDEGDENDEDYQYEDGRRDKAVKKDSVNGWYTTVAHFA